MQFCFECNLYLCQCNICTIQFFMHITVFRIFIKKCICTSGFSKSRKSFVWSIMTLLHIVLFIWAALSEHVRYTLIPDQPSYCIKHTGSVFLTFCSSSSQFLLKEAKWGELCCFFKVSLNLDSSNGFIEPSIKKNNNIKKSSKFYVILPSFHVLLMLGVLTLILKITAIYIYHLHMKAVTLILSSRGSHRITNPFRSHHLKFFRL